MAEETNISEVKPKRRPRRTDRQLKAERDKNLRLSLAFYLALFLLLAQFAANALGHVPFNSLFLSINGAIVLGGLFGPKFVIEFFRAVRGSRSDRNKDNTHA